MFAYGAEMHEETLEPANAQARARTPPPIVAEPAPSLLGITLPEPLPFACIVDDEEVDGGGFGGLCSCFGGGVKPEHVKPPLPGPPQ